MIEVRARMRTGRQDINHMEVMQKSADDRVRQLLYMVPSCLALRTEAPANMPILHFIFQEQV